MRREERFAAVRDMVALLRAEAARLQAEEQERCAGGADGAALESERGEQRTGATTIGPLRPASRETKAPPPSAPSSTPSSAPSAAPPAKTLKAKKAAAAAAAAAEAEYERLRRRAPLRCAPGGGWDLLDFFGVFGRGGWDEEGLAEAHYQLDLDEAYGEEEEVFPGFDGDGMEEGFSRPPPDAYSDIMQSMLFDSRDENMFFDWLGEGDEDWTGA